MRIHTLCCGSMSLTKGTVAGGSRLREGVAGLVLPEARRQRLPVCAYLIEHPGGLALVDTGWGPDPAADGRLSPALARYYRPEAERGRSAAEQLAAMGIAPSDLKYVVLTQLTADHTHGLSALSGAGRILVSENEYFWSCRHAFSYLQPRSLWESAGVETYYMRGGPIGPTGRSYDLFGDGSVLLVETPGYTTGQASVLLQGRSGRALISSDLAFSAALLREGRLAGHLFYRVPGRRSLSWLRETALDRSCAACLVNHDPESAAAPPVEL